MPLTPSEIALSAGQYLVIGRRPDGDRVVLKETRTRELAEAIRRQFAPRLEGYAAITVERVGAVATEHESETPPATPD